MSARLSLVTAVALLTTANAGTSQTVVLRSGGGRTAESSTQRDPVPATQRVTAGVPVQLLVADAHRHGEVWLEVSADATGNLPAHITLRIPLSNTGDAYGESRSCRVAPDNSLELTFTAGLAEDNYVPFAPAEAAQPMHLLLNKYLCRALAAPFQCNGKAVSESSDWSQWRLGAFSRVLLSSDAPATLSTSAVRVQATGEAFDPASCKVIAPSDGLCCVSTKTTEWHCGGTPAGAGWHQVSGECFHRETGGSCKAGDTLQLLTR